MTIRYLAAVLTTLASSFLVSASAGTIAYPGPAVGPGGASGWQGATAWYLSVEETNTLGGGGAAVPLHNTPDVALDSIDFNPTGFQARSETPGTTNTTTQLNFNVAAQPGRVIESFRFAQAGDTTIVGGPSTDDNRTSVVATLMIEVLEINGVAPPVAISFQKALTYNPSAGDFLLNTDSGGGVFYQASWSGMASIDVATELVLAGYSAQATLVAVTVDTTLSASTVGGNSAFIKLKDADGLVTTDLLITTNNVPEPSALGLLTLGLLTAARRRG
ncbi:PEP-CTERM sorting domain-containing protein [Botrimarina hoheduenensis]|uniref:Ice-binding protein C-terminal domain-containing protein n=1 Tax=Botrimarina hoheduenensis TaxID=2528000 RepID=A0A5C5WCV4_9BACT|nr:PEP-CTERM sorting domain-containing protein [Botrimarina hoheduenensis]TWT48758.1 hypothetical protein Pla111_05330 [Botrimarina hoheduenensis]